MEDNVEQSQVVKKRGRPAGSKNKPKTVPPPSPVDGESVPVNVRTDFFSELETTLTAWESSCERPILYDFECAKEIRGLINKYSM